MSALDDLDTTPGRTRSRMAVLVLIAAVVLVGVGLAASQLVPMLIPPAGPGVAVTSPAPSASPRVSGSPAPSDLDGYDAVFSGDASGATDVTDELAAFLSSHDGQTVALAPEGVYQVSQMTFTANDLTVDFRGARIEGALVGAYGIFLVRDSSNIVLNDPYVIGTGYEWDGGDNNPLQWEHGIEIDGGSNIEINRPVTRNTRGDGIYIGFDAPRTKPPTGVVITEPDIERSARNGIAPVAGEVTIKGGHIYESGLHGVDFEPNNDEGALSIIGIVDGVDIRKFSDLDVAGLKGYAVAAFGYSKAPKPSIVVQNVTGDILRMLIPDTANVVVQNNVSDLQAVADFEGSDSVTFIGNVRIAQR